MAKITAAQQTFESVKAGSASVRAKLDRGLTTRPDLLLSIQEQAKTSYDLQDARGSVTQTRADLTTNLGISPAYSLQMIDLSKLPLPAKLEQSVDLNLDREALGGGLPH